MSAFPTTLSNVTAIANSTSLSVKPHAFEDISITKPLSRGKFPVYLAFSLRRKTNYAIKFFPFSNNNSSHHYQNESRFLFLAHPNIIKFIHNEERSSINQRQLSCILMEYAPYGDFYHFITSFGQMIDEMLIRTYFVQLIEGLEYLHSQGVWHLDLKLDNLLVGDNYQLKIADFDLSFKKGDSKIRSKGTKFFRAPEIKDGQGKDGATADIYSAGVVLFVLLSQGVLPFEEDGFYQDKDLMKLLHTDTQEFFRIHCELQRRDALYFNTSFQELITSMMKVEPEQRATIKDIKSSLWYQGPIYSKEELKEKGLSLFGY